MKNLIVLVGPPGSGKSTVARDYKDDGYTYINQDSQGRKEHLDLFMEAITKGENVVIDRMNFNVEQRKRYLLPAAGRGYETRVVVLHQPYSVCLERCLARKDHETIRDEGNARSALALFFGKYERPTDDEADAVDFVYPQLDMHKPDAIICDLDGTMCAIDHRLHFVRKPQGVKKDWKSFFKGIPDDSVNSWCADIVRSMAEKGHQIVYCSGRPDNYRGDTLEWLQRHNLWDFDTRVPGSSGSDSLSAVLYMRPRNDQRDDSIVKEIILDFEILTRFTPYFMIDDRARVVAMWRKRGFTTLACADGDF